MAVGFFGKLLSHGDFVSRRLPADWLQHWDGWLQQGLSCSQQQFGVDWPQYYLVAPLWRFLLGCGSVNQQAWAGVLMPSVDRVGRYYPLTLAAPLDAGADLGASYAANLEWFEQLEALALSCLAPDFHFDDFDQALQLMPAPMVVAHSGESAAPMQLLAGSHLTQLALPASHAHCLWLSITQARSGMRVFYSPGLPPPKAFSALLDADAGSRLWS